MVEVPDRLGARGLEPTFAASRLLPAEALPKALAGHLHRRFAQWREPRSRSVLVVTRTASPDCSLAPSLENGRDLCPRVQQVYYYHLTLQRLQLRIMMRRPRPALVIPDSWPATGAKYESR